MRPASQAENVFSFSLPPYQFDLADLQNVIRSPAPSHAAEPVFFSCVSQQPANSTVAVIVKAQEFVRISQDAEAAPVTCRHLHTLPGVLLTQQRLLVLSLTRAGKIN